VTLFESEAFFDLSREVLVALHLPAFFVTGQHDDQLNFLLPNHAPKILYGVREGPLSRDEKLIVLSSGGIDVVCIDIRIIDIGVSLCQPHASVLDYNKIIGSVRSLQGLRS
jgi:hypothetical protein